MLQPLRSHCGSFGLSLLRAGSVTVLVQQRDAISAQDERYTSSYKLHEANNTVQDVMNLEITSWELEWERAQRCGTVRAQEGCVMEHSHQVAIKQHSQTVCQQERQRQQQQQLRRRQSHNKSNSSGRPQPYKYHHQHRPPLSLNKALLQPATATSTTTNINRNM